MMGWRRQLWRKLAWIGLAGEFLKLLGLEGWGLSNPFITANLGPRAVPQWGAGRWIPVVRQISRPLDPIIERGPRRIAEKPHVLASKTCSTAWTVSLHPAR